MIHKDKKIKNENPRLLTGVPIGAKGSVTSLVFKVIMTEQQHNQPTDRPTDEHEELIITDMIFLPDRICKCRRL